MILYFSDLCPSQFTLIEATGQCYLVSQKLAFSWSEAKQECERRGASMIALQTEAKYNAIENWYADSKYTATKLNECHAVFA